MTTATWLWIFLAIFVIIMVVDTIRGAKATKTVEDYAIARGLFGPITLAFSFTASTKSATIYLGISGWVYTAGMSGLWFAFLIWMGFVLGIIMYCRSLRRSADEFGAISVVDWLGRRYNSNLLTIIGVILLLMNVFMIAANLI